MTATAAEPSVALVLVVNVQKLRKKIFSIEMPHMVTAKVVLVLMQPRADSCVVIIAQESVPLIAEH